MENVNIRRSQSIQFKPLNYGVEISNINLSSCSSSDLKELIGICIKERLVVIKNQNLSVERFNEINDIFGIHHSIGIWASHSDFPKIFRVTNKEISEGKKGFLGDQNIPWHCNGTFAPYPEDCLCLYCITPGSSGGVTEFADGVHAYNQLNDSIKEEIQSARVFIPAQNRYQDTFSDDENQDLNQLIVRTKPLNLEKKNIKGAYVYSKQSKGEDREKPLVTKHPLSQVKGLYFPFRSVSEIRGLKTPSRSKEIFDILVDSYIGKRGLIYEHSWGKGDFILSDQLHSLHQRQPFEGLRELYRTVFWYHS